MSNWNCHNQGRLQKREKKSLSWGLKRGLIVWFFFSRVEISFAGNKKKAVKVSKMVLGMWDRRSTSATASWVYIRFHLPLCLRLTAQRFCSYFSNFHCKQSYFSLHFLLLLVWSISLSSKMQRFSGHLREMVAYKSNLNRSSPSRSTDTVKRNEML